MQDENNILYQYVKLNIIIQNYIFLMDNLF